MEVEEARDDFGKSGSGRRGHFPALKSSREERSRNAGESPRSVNNWRSDVATYGPTRKTMAQNTRRCSTRIMPSDAAVPSSQLDMLGVIVDYLFPDVDAYEAALYIFLFRKSLFIGETSVRIGKRSISDGFVRGARGGGDGNRGGHSVNYAHLSESLKSLERKGCIQSGDTTREGTLYTVVLPTDIASVAARMSAVSRGPPAASDYFTDPLRRKEVFERDRWLCQYCGERLNPDTATLDHFIPQSRGGDHRKENLRSACLMCNSIKSGKSYDEAAPLLLQSVAQRRVKAG